jgi:probable rRNA maturation factor
MICYERAALQAEEYGHSLTRELSFLTVHGVLHLLGYDHMTEPEETEMRAHQTAILNEMGVTR